LVGQGGALTLDFPSASVELLGPPLQLDQLDEPGLVEIDQATALGIG
jgi:hypothetical protein